MTRVPLRSAAATSIGSLPHTDPQAAVDFVFGLQPALPAAPQLPHRSGAELMLSQSATAGQLSGESWLTSRLFLEEAGRRDARAVKLQLAGPVTVGLAHVKQGAQPGAAFAAAAVSVEEQARALVGLATACVPAAQLVVFLDEPGLTACTSRTFPLDGDAVQDLLSGALAALGTGTVTGIHCCGPTDLALIAGAGPDIISVPVAAELVEASGTISGHLDRGGWMAWGAVPTDRPIGNSVDSLWRQLADVWCGLTQGGCDPVLLRQQSLLTPACGLAGHRVEQAEQVLRLTGELAERVHSQSVAARLSVGA